MGLDRLVDAVDRRLAARVLRHVGRFAGAGRTGVVERSCLLRHQAGELELDLCLGERV